MTDRAYTADEIIEEIRTRLHKVGLPVTHDDAYAVYLVALRMGRVPTPAQLYAIHADTNMERKLAIEELSLMTDARIAEIEEKKS